jgi:hypothetical protein
MPAVGGGSRRAWRSRRCRLGGRVQKCTVAFAQTTGALAFVEIIYPAPEGPGLAIPAPGAREYGNAATPVLLEKVPGRAGANALGV